MNTFAMVMPGPTEWVVILMIVLVMFGAKKLPELAKSLGQGMNEFRKARQEFDKELQEVSQDVKVQPPNTQTTSRFSQLSPTSLRSSFSLTMSDSADLLYRGPNQRRFLCILENPK